MGGGTISTRHSGQSSVWREAASPPSSELDSNCITPVPEHTSASVSGLANGDAMATPVTKA
jgi:hypothetical protein